MSMNEPMSFSESRRLVVQYSAVIERLEALLLTTQSERDQARKEREEAVIKWREEITRGRKACKEILDMELKAQRENYEAEIKRVDIINARHVVERNENRQRAEAAEEALREIARGLPGVPRPDGLTEGENRTGAVIERGVIARFAEVALEKSR